MGKKKRSPHRRARREALNTPKTATISHYGVSISVSEEVFRDVDFIDNTLTIEAPNASDMEKTGAAIVVAKLLAGDKWGQLVKAIRAKNGGLAPLDEVMSFVKKSFQAIAPEPTAS